MSESEKELDRLQTYTLELEGRLAQRTRTSDFLDSLIYTLHKQGFKGDSAVDFIENLKLRYIEQGD
jgi:hypothetical protein